MLCDRPRPSPRERLAIENGLNRRGAAVIKKKLDVKLIQSHPTGMRITITDVARAVGVSETTVSLAFQEGSRISAATRERVMKVANSLNYSPNLTARRLRYGKTRTIGILVNDITNPFYAGMVRAASDTAARRGYEVFVTDSQWDPEKEVAELRRLVESRVEGILACFCERTDEGIGLLTREGLPFLALDTYPKGFKGAFVVNDLVETGRLAAEHLADVGCRHPALFVVDGRMKDFSAFTTIRTEFLRTLQERRLPVRESPSPQGGLTIEGGLHALETLMRAYPDTDGVFCPNTLHALGAMEAADRLGIKVGRDLAILGVDDLDICELSRLSLTAIRQPYDLLAQLATDALMDTFTSKKKPLNIRVSLKPELIVRASTKLKISSSGKAKIAAADA